MEKYVFLYLFIIYKNKAWNKIIKFIIPFIIIKID